ncbi:type IV secretory pathway VirB6-like protein [Virgibacillus natechei]|uniref:Type IV secretory pathway VirB6-like protein n=1 Tax=Virgibacillus natechei TaxID=1216297 RepID=A0ABS4IC51_9BACI|nr:hypothetical protein [Virgibacillus natechei]MBP1968522.1 type IV secretory pathway VirB6-like protein [Virgibacillus natechei]UZD13637.1 hypothetical protein OLD84_03510 [Virgibacillus natechei]
MNSKFFKPKYENKVQRPGKFQKFTMYILMVIGVFSLFGSVLGFLTKVTEMALAFGVIAVVTLAAVILLKRAYNTSYEENFEYFILISRNKENQVFYENIIDWQPSFNEIKILDKTKSDKKYIRVNIKFFKPEILLRKMADMAFDGKFNTINPEDPTRKIDTVYYLVDNRYGYLVEDYVDKIENKYQLND